MGSAKGDVLLADCRAYAEGKWIEVQQATSSSGWASPADYANHYATMDYSPPRRRSCAEFYKFKNSGQLYRGSKPVMWSPVERTALADAEIEYHDHVSAHDLGQVPGDRGASDDHPDDLLERSAHQHALGGDLDHHARGPSPPTARSAMAPTSPMACTRSTSMEQGLEFEPWAKAGDRLILADKLAEDVFKAAKIADLDPAWTT